MHADSQTFWLERQLVQSLGQQPPRGVSHGVEAPKQTHKQEFSSSPSAIQRSSKGQQEEAERAWDVLLLGGLLLSALRLHEFKLFLAAISGTLEINEKRCNVSV